MKPKFWPILEWMIPREYVEKPNRLTFRIAGRKGFNLVIEEKNVNYPEQIYIRFEEIDPAKNKSCINCGHLRYQKSYKTRYGKAPYRCRRCRADARPDFLEDPYPMWYATRKM